MHVKAVFITLLINLDWTLSIPFNPLNLEITISKEPLRFGGASQPLKSSKSGPKRCDGGLVSDKSSKDLLKVSTPSDIAEVRVINFESFELGDIFEPVKFKDVSFMSGSILSLESVFPSIAAIVQKDRVWVTTADNPSLALQFADNDCKAWDASIAFVDFVEALSPEGIPSAYLRVRSDSDWHLSSERFSIHWTEWGFDEHVLVAHKETEKSKITHVESPDNMVGFFHAVNLTFDKAGSENFALISELVVY